MSGNDREVYLNIIKKKYFEEGKISEKIATLLIQNKYSKPLVDESFNDVAINDVEIIYKHWFDAVTAVLFHIYPTENGIGKSDIRKYVFYKLINNIDNNDIIFFEENKLASDNSDNNDTSSLVIFQNTNFDEEFNYENEKQYIDNFNSFKQLIESNVDNQLIESNVDNELQKYNLILITRINNKYYIKEMQPNKDDLKYTFILYKKIYTCKIPPKIFLFQIPNYFKNFLKKYGDRKREYDVKITVKDKKPNVKHNSEFYIHLVNQKIDDKYFQILSDFFNPKNNVEDVEDYKNLDDITDQNSNEMLEILISKVKNDDEDDITNDDTDKFNENDIEKLKKLREKTEEYDDDDTTTTVNNELNKLLKLSNTTTTEENKKHNFLNLFSFAI